MKKKFLFIAAAALLLSGGVFVKVNKTDNLLLNNNIMAFSEDGYGTPGEPVKKWFELSGYPANAHVFPVNAVDKRGTLVDANGNGGYWGWGCGPTKDQLFCAEVNGTVEVYR